MGTGSVIMYAYKIVAEVQCIEMARLLPEQVFLYSTGPLVSKPRRESYHFICLRIFIKAYLVSVGLPVSYCVFTNIVTSKRTLQEPIDIFGELYQMPEVFYCLPKPADASTLCRHIKMILPNQGQWWSRVLVGFYCQTVVDRPAVSRYSAHIKTSLLRTYIIVSSMLTYEHFPYGIKWFLRITGLRTSRI
jgi:hypothetical protein